jgi:formate dehydrogenase subunit gamma
MAGQRVVIASTPYERVIHWVLAGTCLALVFTGLIIAVNSFAPLAEMLGGYRAVKEYHRFIGLVFTIALVFGVSHWYKEAGYIDKTDIEWMKAAGGYLWKAKIPEPYKYNAGQKLFFITVALYGAVMVATGLLLWFGKGLIWAPLMRWTVVFHALGVAVMGGFSMVHIYLGTVGTTGSLPVMTDGKVTEAWAKTHMPGYYREKIAKSHGKAKA